MTPQRLPPSRNHVKSPLIQYITHRRTSKLSTYDLPMEKNAIGYISPMGFFFTSVKLTVPLAYIYILLILWREASLAFPWFTESSFMNNYCSLGVWIAKTMRSSSPFMEWWAIVEGIFYVILWCHRKWLNSLDTLELSLRSAPMLEMRERAELWEYMMADENECVRFIEGWFFGEKLERLTRYDVMDFLTWSMFEGRNMEHLTQDEMGQLSGFVDDLEYKISVELHGVETGEEGGEEKDEWNVQRGEVGGCKKRPAGEYSISSLDNLCPPSPLRQHLMQNYGTQHLSPKEHTSPTRFKSNRKENRPIPKKTFQFQESRDVSQHSYFSNLYESYKDWCTQQYRDMNFHPVQDIRNFVAEKRQTLHEAEQSAVATASNMYDYAYFTIIERGGNIDRRLSQLGHDAWNSMWKMKERLETASDISARRKALRQQLKSYQQTLVQMRKSAMAVPSKQMADLMKKISQCHEALENVERSAMDAFLQVTGFVGNHLTSKEPPRYLKYSADPIMDVSSYPLMFHILILLVTDGGLRFMMKMRGFQRLRVGPVSYYFHPGAKAQRSNNNVNDNEDNESIPIVFCHGIGLGVIFYIALVDELLKLGRPLIFPEISYVSGFRPWQGPNCVLPPAAVTSTLMSILACHGYARGAFLGHSYGTSWVSFMCKYAPSAVAAVMFLDPICFCLHCPRLTKQFVYRRADPGSTAHMIRTDININWTIQRGFPWARISLFTEQIPCVPCAIFLSERDQLVPSVKVENYLRKKGAIVKSADEAGFDHYTSFAQQGHPINLTIFRGQGHGDWPLETSTNRLVADAASAILTQIRPYEFGGDE